MTIAHESDPSIPPHTPEIVAPRGERSGERDLEVAHVAYHSSLSIVGTWLPAAVCRRVTACHYLSWHGCRLSLAFRISSLSIHSPSGGKIQAVLERYHGAYGTSIKRDRTRVLCLEHWCSLSICFTPVEPLNL